MIKPVLMIVGLLQIIWDLRVLPRSSCQDAGGVARDTNLIGPTSTGWGSARGSSGWRPRAWFIWR